MEVLRCVQCKGEIALEENGLIGRCLSCGSIYYFKSEKNSRIISLLNQANISRLRGDYDGAILAYQIALKEDETDADAYWGILLSEFGIEYIEDPRTKTFIPTCRRTIAHSILSDENYLNAIRYASPEQAKEFERQANEIDQLQNSIKEKIKDEQDFDVFLCFKSTDDEGNPTQDRFIARNIYGELDKRGIRTFFSEISLKDRLGQDYEPIIYKALYTCKVFILVATKEEYIQASWVKNEWSRFRDRAVDENIENSAFCVFKDIKTNELPPIFRTQGIDLAKYPAGGYEIEIADNLEIKLKQKKFSTLDERFEEMIRQNSSFVLEDKVVDLLERKLVGTRQTYEEKLDRALAYEEIGNHEKALGILDEIIDEYPRKALGWFYKAKLITNGFQINPMEFHLDEKLKEEYVSLIANAIRFASDDNRKMIEEQTQTFNKNVGYFVEFDQNAELLEKGLESFCILEDKITNCEKENAENSVKSKNDLLYVFEQNTNKIKELRKHVNNKKYYIRNIPTSPNFAYSFFNFLGFIVITTALIGSMINLKKAVDGSGSMLRVIFEFVFLMIVGILPFVIVEILRTQNKLKKVRDVIENDKQKLEKLKEENAQIKIQIDAFDKQQGESLTKIQDTLNEFNDEFEKIKNQIVEIYNLVQKRMKENDFMVEYVKRYEQFSQKELDDRLEINNSDIKILGEERQNIIRANEKNKREIFDKKPKYFSENYESLAQKATMLVQKNNQRIIYIDNRVKELELENKIFLLQKEKTFSNPTFFDSFIAIEPEQLPEEQIETQVDEENSKDEIEDSKGEEENSKDKVWIENKPFNEPKKMPSTKSKKKK